MRQFMPGSAVRPRRPAVLVALVFAPAVLAGVEFPAFGKLFAWPAATFGALAATLLCLRRFGASKAVFCCAVAATGLWLGGRSISPDFGTRHIANFENKKITVRGMLYKLPREYPDKTHLFVEAREYPENGRRSPAEGNIRLTVGKNCPPLTYGDEIVFSTVPRRPSSYKNPGVFDYARHLASRGIFVTGYVKDGRKIARLGNREGGIFHHVQRFRQNTARKIDELSGRGEAGKVLRALILGDRWVVPGDVNESFARAGVAHLLAVSGLHLAIVASLIYWLILWLLKRSERLMLAVEVGRAAALLAIPPVILYTELAGGRIPTLRAAVMVVVYLVAVALERSSDLRSAIAVAAIILLAAWPASITSAGFILSFTAVIVIAEAVPVLQKRIQPKLRENNPGKSYRIKEYILFSLLTGVAILAAISPMVMRMFHQFQYLSPVTNLLFIPVVGYLVLPLGIVSVIVNSMSGGLGSMLLRLDLRLVGGVVEAAEWFARSPGTGAMAPAPSLPQVATVFAMVIFGLRFIARKGAPRADVAAGLLLSATLLAAFTGGNFVRNHFADRMEVTFLDVGGSDCTVIRAPGGKTVLIDAGDRFGNFDSGERVIGPYLLTVPAKSIDLIIVTHPHYNNIGGLEWLLDNFDIGRIWMADAAIPGEYIERVAAPARKAGVPVRKLSREDGSVRFGGLRFDIFWPPKGYRPSPKPWPDVNASSLAFRVTGGNVSFLFAGDAEARTQGEILKLEKSLRADVLMAPHHADKGSVSEEFLEAVKPKAVVVSTRPSPRRKYPDEDVLRRISESGAKIIRTDLSGAVRVEGRKNSIRLSGWTGRLWKETAELPSSR